MFNKDLDDVKDLERLEDLEKTLSVERIIASSTSPNEFFDPSLLTSNLST